MDIVITDVRVTASQQMVFELFRAGIKEIQPPVFGSNPDVTVGIFAELADYISLKENFPYHWDNTTRYPYAWETGNSLH